MGAKIRDKLFPIKPFTNYFFQAMAAWTNHCQPCGETTSAPTSRTSWWRWRWWGLAWGLWPRSTGWPSTGPTGSPTAPPTPPTPGSSAGYTGNSNKPEFLDMTEYRNKIYHSWSGGKCPFHVAESRQIYLVTVFGHIQKFPLTSLVKCWPQPIWRTHFPESFRSFNDPPWHPVRYLRSYWACTLLWCRSDLDVYLGPPAIFCTDI